MIKKNQIYLILSIIVFVFSCEMNRYSPFYSNLLRSYPREFVNHFPYKIYDGIVNYSTGTEFDVTGLFLLQKDSSKSFYVLQDSLKKIAIANYSAQDTCLFVVNKFTNEQNLTKEKKVESEEISKYFQKECLKEKLPIANFWGIYHENINTSPQLPKDFNIYVLDAKKGLYWDKKHISKGKYMPDFWKHGFSKGIALNENTHEIIYWFVLW